MSEGRSKVRGFVLQADSRNKKYSVVKLRFEIEMISNPILRNNLEYIKQQYAKIEEKRKLQLYKLISIRQVIISSEQQKNSKIMSGKNRSFSVQSKVAVTNSKYVLLGYSWIDAKIESNKYVREGAATFMCAIQTPCR